MSPENFAYWLQGFFEIAGTDELTADQVKIVKDHLALVFEKVTPDRRVKPKKERKARKVKNFDLERWLKETDKNDFRDVTVTCSSTQSPLSDLTFCSSALEAAAKENAPIDREKVEKAMEKAREKAEKARESLRKAVSPTRWVGGGFGQRYC